MGFKVSVGDKTYNIKIPKFLRAKASDTPVSAGHAAKAKADRKNELDRIDRELSNAGKSQMETEIFDNDYTDN
jgi:hypothetical protein